MTNARSCEGCALCCKLLEIKALNKPMNQWCTHCVTKQSCSIYEERPDTCRKFNCGYITHASLPDHWQPIKSRMMVVFAEGDHIFIQVDPARADAWKAKPYYNDLKTWARQFNPQGKQVVVSIARRYIAITPDKDIDIGLVADDETVTFDRIPVPGGFTTQIRKIKLS